jgi:hypothetical protein
MTLKKRASRTESKTGSKGTTSKQCCFCWICEGMGEVFPEISWLQQLVSSNGAGEEMSRGGRQKLKPSFVVLLHQSREAGSGP